MNHIISEINTATGELVIRQMTSDENAVFSSDQAFIANQKLEKEAEEAAKAEAKASAETKLLALGLTSEEIAAIL